VGCTPGDERPRGSDDVSGEKRQKYVAITASGASALDDPMPEGSEALVVFALP